MKKKIAALVLALVMSVANKFAVQAETPELTVQAAYDPDTRAFTVSGQISSGEGQTMTVRIIYPDGVQYMNQTTSGDDGEFALTYILRQAVPGTYQVRVGGNGVKAPAVVYVTVEEPSSGRDDDQEPDPGNEQEQDDDPGSSDYAEAPSSPDHTLVEGNRISLRAEAEDGKARAVLHEELIAQLASEEVIIVEVEMTEGADSLQLELPAALFNASDTSGRLVRIVTPLASFVMDSATLMDPGADEGGTITLDIALVEASLLPGKAAVTLQGKAVYDFRLAWNENPISEFNGRLAMRVSIPYTLESGEHPSAVVVYAISGQGEPELINNGKYDPATGEVVFYAPHFSWYAAVGHPVEFSDADAARWAEDDIVAMSARNILGEVEPGVYAPNATINRAEFVSMIVNALDLRGADSRSEFQDIPESYPHAEAIASAVTHGIVQGVGQGRFSPDRSLTREEMFVMTARAIRAMGVSIEEVREPVAFLDADLISTYAVTDILQLSSAGLIDGKGNGLLDPQGRATRAEAAAATNRLLNFVYWHEFGL